MSQIDLFGGDGATRRPGCCICDPAVCAADDSGDHCVERSCGVCLHGCPAPYDQPCCLDGEVAG